MTEKKLQQVEFLQRKQRVTLLWPTIEHFEEADEMHKKQTDENKSKNEADTQKAAEMRRHSLETFFESNARLGNEPVVKKSRNTGSETVQYLREKVIMN